MRGRYARWLAAFLAALGLALSAGLEVLHVRTYLVPTEEAFCIAGDAFDCTTVALSRWSVIGGIPVALWGVVGFTSIVWAAFGRSPLLFPLSILAVVASVMLLVVELVAIGSVCLLCEGVHLLGVLVALAAWRTFDPAELRWYLARPREWTWDLAVPVAMIVAIRLAVPAYWTRTSVDESFARGFDEHGRPWIGAEQPALVVHEYVDYACPHCAVATVHTRIRLARHPDELRIVRHHQPRMRCTPATSAGDKCRWARAAICAGDQGKFWQMDEWLFVHMPRRAEVKLEDAVGELELDPAAFAAGLQAPATYERAELDGAEARERKITGTPGYVIDDHRLSTIEALDRIDERL